MFGQSNRHERRTEEANEPLLADSDNLVDDQTIFKLDSDDEDESSALNHTGDRRDHTVRFEEHVQVIGPPLRSMLASRETGEYVIQFFLCLLNIILEFEQDTDELDESNDLEDVQVRVPRGYTDSTMPLLVGLFDSSASRGRVDASVPLRRTNGEPETQQTDVDLEELAAKRIAGGGIFDSIANMANSILGAGEFSFFSKSTSSWS
jgi:sodium-coupled neutral amino acid transporter 11